MHKNHSNTLATKFPLIAQVDGLLDEVFGDSSDHGSSDSEDEDGDTVDSDDPLSKQQHGALLRAVRGQAVVGTQAQDPNALVQSEAYQEGEHNLNPTSSAAGEGEGGGMVDIGEGEGGGMVGIDMCVCICVYVFSCIPHLLTHTHYTPPYTPHKPHPGALRVADLIAGLGERAGQLGSARKTLEKLSAKGGPVQAPLPAVVRDRQTRKAGYQEAKKDVSKWQPIVQVCVGVWVCECGWRIIFSVTTI